MTIDIDPRDLFSSIPQAPRDEKGLVVWAKRLTSVLKLKEERKDNKTYTPDYAASLEFNPSLANILVVNTVHATGNCTITALAGKVGLSWIIINNDATGAKTITFGTGFSPSGTLVGTVSKTAVVGFLSDGQKLYEVSRITGLTT